MRGNLLTADGKLMATMVQSQNQPNYSFAVMIEGDTDQNLHGGSDAAPIVAKIFSQVYASK